MAFASYGSVVVARTASMASNVNLDDDALAFNIPP
jgi:hypothetical protein